MRFPAKKKAGCPILSHAFPQRKDGILLPRRIALGLPSPFPRVCTDGPVRRTYPGFTTKISCIDWLPDLLTPGALLIKFHIYELNGSNNVSKTTKNWL